VGVVNVTPDSFSDGGKFLDARAACAHVDRLIDEGADVIEVGGESTRPAGPAYGGGYAPVDARTQIERVLPVIAYAARERRALVAVDTTSPEVAEAALDAGAAVVNDVSTLADVALAKVVAARGAWLVLMHARPGAASTYDDVVAEVAREWGAARDRAVEAGVEPSRIVFDPGIGFGKGAENNLRLVAELGRFGALGHSLYVGPSRKSFIGVVEEKAGGRRSDPGDRLGGTIAACLLAVRNGACALRVHDVAAVRQALLVAGAIDAASNRAEGGG
jgi:dihydropteroate synthase